MAGFSLETPRLRLREWTPADETALHPIGRDPAVMEFLGPLETHEDSALLIAGQMRNQALFGHCFWPVEQRSGGALIGYCGINLAPEGTPLEGQLEIGWRLARHAWGHGFASEAAAACLAWGFANLPPSSIAAMTVPANLRSQRVMERLAMTRRPDLDFDHPGLPEGDPLRRHIVHAIDRDSWNARNG